MQTYHVTLDLPRRVSDKSSCSTGAVAVSVIVVVAEPVASSACDDCATFDGEGKEAVLELPPCSSALLLVLSCC